MGVSQSISKKIKAFYCHICRRKKPSLSIRYKKKFQEFLKNKSSHQAVTDPILLRFLKEIRIREKKEIELNNNSKPHSSSSSSSSSTSTISSSHQQHKKIETKSSHHHSLKENISSHHHHHQVPAPSQDLNLQASPTKCYGKSNVSGEDIQNFVSAITKLGHDAAQLASDSLITDKNVNMDNESRKKIRKISTSHDNNSKPKNDSDNDDSYSMSVTHRVKKPRNNWENSSQEDSENNIDSDVDGLINDDTEGSNDDSQDDADSDNDTDFSVSSEGMLFVAF